MTFSVSILKNEESRKWDEYVHNHTSGNLYLLSGWKKVIEQSYGHKTFYLKAVSDSDGKIVGILPLVHIKHFLFGNSLISIPFFDMSGMLTSSNKVQKCLVDKAIKIRENVKADVIEIREMQKAEIYSSFSYPSEISCIQKDHKVRMILKLPGNSQDLLSSFKSKLRSQIKKPMKGGLTVDIGSAELIDEFYNVFIVNMRDLGSPVHSKKLFLKTMEYLGSAAKVVLVKHQGKAVAGSVICGFGNVLQNPWSSSLRQYSRFSPNMLLYWTMLEYACDNGFAFFDFGRSTPGEGTYRFKKQWGAEPTPLYWYYIVTKKNLQNDPSSSKKKLSTAIGIWRSLPVGVTSVLGPIIRKYIGL